MEICNRKYRVTSTRVVKNTRVVYSIIQVLAAARAPVCLVLSAVLRFKSAGVQTASK